MQSLGLEGLTSLPWNSVSALKHLDRRAFLCAVGGALRKEQVQPASSQTRASSSVALRHGSPELLKRWLETRLGLHTQ